MLSLAEASGRKSAARAATKSEGRRYEGEPKALDDGFHPSPLRPDYRGEVAMGGSHRRGASPVLVEAPGFRHLSRHVSRQAQSTVDRYAKALYDLLQQKNYTRFHSTALTMMSELVAAAISAAGDQALASYIGSVHGELTRLVATSDWTACDTFLEGAAFTMPRRLPAYFLWDYAAALTALLRSANASHWKASDFTAGAELSAREFLAQARRLVLVADASSSF